MRLRRALRGQEGAALVVAIFFLTLFALLVGAVLSFAATTSASSSVYANRQQVTYAADSAVDAAIAVNNGGSCPPGGFTGPSVSDTAPATTSTVNGTPFPVSIDCSGPAGTDGHLTITATVTVSPPLRQIAVRATVTNTASPPGSGPTILSWQAFP